MLKSIILKNYRCFENSELSFRELTVIVGKNNAGKSTIVEALRLVAEAGRRAKNAIFTNPPRQLNIPWSDKGIRIDHERLKVDLRVNCTP
jgi:predicted ATP-binding protein involved in virulence